MLVPLERDRNTECRDDALWVLLEWLHRIETWTAVGLRVKRIRPKFSALAINGEKKLYPVSKAI